MWEKISEREKKMLLILFALIAVFVIYKFMWLKQSEIYANADANFKIVNNQLNDYKDTSKNLASLQKESSTLQNKFTAVSAPFHVDIMGGEQMQYTGEIFENAGLKVISAAPAAPKDEKEFYTQDITFKVQGTYGALQQFFYDIENSPYAFSVSKFDVYPEANDQNPALVGLNYNKLTADVIISVHGDKSAKVEQTLNQKTAKMDLFKPTDSDMQKLKIIEKAYAKPNTSGNTSIVSNQNTYNNNPAPFENTLPKTDYSIKKAPEKKTINQNQTKPKPAQPVDNINYEFETR